MLDNIYKNKYSKGYTLLFSIIVSSIVLSIAVFILSVSRKQFILSSISRDSTMAIYAADSALQCMLSAVYDGETLSTSSGIVAVSCNNNNPSFSLYVEDNTLGYNLKKDGGYKIYRLEDPLLFGFNNDTCARVNVIRGHDSNDNSIIRTIIESSGYTNAFSQPCSENGGYNPRTVERSIRFIFED